MTKRMKIDDLEPAAREATRKALEPYSEALAPYRASLNLTLGTVIEDDYAVFQLYVAGEKPSDAVILSSARVSRTTGNVLGVDVFLPRDA